MVGTARFELATPCTPSKCATRLRYVPMESAAQDEDDDDSVGFDSQILHPVGSHGRERPFAAERRLILNCHPERSEGSAVRGKMQIPRFARDDKNVVNCG
jgi:hypothetical protein